MALKPSQLVALFKADNPLSGRGFDAWVRRVARALGGAAGPEERQAARDSLAVLDRDWAAMTPQARRRVIRDAQDEIEGLPRAVVLSTKPVFERWAPRIFRSVRNFTWRTLKLKAPKRLRDLDDRMVKFVSESPTNFVTDVYRQRVVAFEPRIRKLVATGLERGLSRDEIRRLLVEDVGFHLVGRSEAYWDMVSGVFTNRARTLSQLSIYEEAGITQYEFVAVLDSRTSHICRFMDGKVYDVADELERFNEMQRLRDPEKVRDLAPFVRDAKDEQGRPVMIAEVGGRRRQIARIEESAMGRAGRRGKFAAALSKSDLVRLGVTVPPLHGNCRSTIVPIA